MVRGDDPEFSFGALQTRFEILDFMCVNKFFFYGEAVGCPESANDDVIVFVDIR